MTTGRTSSRLVCIHHCWIRAKAWIDFLYQWDLVATMLVAIGMFFLWKS